MQRRTKNTLNFTKAGIENLAPPEAKPRAYFYDQKIPGLAVCVTQAGSKSFYVLRRIGNRMEFLRIGGWPAYTVEQARTEASRINGKLADGINPGEEKRQGRKVQTLQEAYEAYLLLPTRTKSKRPRTPKTLHEYKLSFKAYLEHWAGRRLSEISRPDVEELHNKLGAENGHYAANRTLGLLKAIYNAAIDAGYLGVNPAARVRKFEERSRERFLQADELPKFWKALEEEPSQKVRDAIKVMLFTGQRKSNVLQMKCAEVNLEREVWSIPNTKSQKPHNVPLTPVAVEILRRRLEEQPEAEFVFPGLHGHGHLVDIMRSWRNILKRADLADLRLHDLRRSLASWQTITGTNEKTVGRTLGNTDPAATAVYTRLDQAAVRKSMQTATDAIMAAARPPQKRKRAK